MVEMPGIRAWGSVLLDWVFGVACVRGWSLVGEAAKRGSTSS